MIKCAYGPCENERRLRSIYCSGHCQQAAWRDKNREKFNARLRNYMSEKKRKPSSDWETRKQAIIDKYGATRQWKRKQAAQEVSG